jgi:hypothetical protein
MAVIALPPTSPVITAVWVFPWATAIPAAPTDERLVDSESCRVWDAASIQLPGEPDVKDAWVMSAINT